MKIFFKTFGCRTNIYDTELLRAYFSSAEIASSEEEADFVVVNSCTVTNGADSDVRNYLRRIARKEKRAILAGCGAVSKGDELFKERLVWGVLGGENKDKLRGFLQENRPFFALGGLKFNEKKTAVNFDSHTKAFLKIQEGCNFNCSYCIIPQVRGESRSVELAALVKQSKELVANGFSEIVLTGTNIGSFKPSLGALLQELGKIRGLRRVRLGSVEPSQIDEAFLEVCKEDFVEKHLHIALQHTSEEMLRLMRRRNRTKEDLKLFLKLAQEGFGLGTDYIVAHPGESEQIWQEAVENLQNFPLTHIHAFIFSPRSNTYSQELLNKFGAVNGAIGKQRLNQICELVKAKNLNFRQTQAQNNAALSVLVEKKDGEFYSGFDEFYNKCFVKSEENLSKKWVKVTNFEAKEDGNYAVSWSVEN